MTKEYIFVKGAKEHNLKNIDVSIPRNSLCVITGLSGSGKSSLAFDTIYAEGQRRYVESLSSYARQFLDQLQKPDVEYIDGLSPAISIEQKKAGTNPRSTVGTQTEIYDYLRVLFARVGKQYCYKCGQKVTQQSSQEITENILKAAAGQKTIILAPKVSGRKGEYLDLFDRLRKDGFLRVRVDGKIFNLDEDEIKLQKNKKHHVEVVVDRINVTEDAKKRLTDSVETAIAEGNGVVIVAIVKNDKTEEHVFSQMNACLKCGISFQELAPRSFSFNSPYGACPVCDGLGNKIEIDPELVIPFKDEPVISCVQAFKRGGKGVVLFYRRMIRGVAREYGFDAEAPFSSLSKGLQKILLFGDSKGFGGFEGIINILERRFRETESEFIKEEINKYMSIQPCPECKGARLKKESLAVKIGNKNISEITWLSVKEAKTFFCGLTLNETEKEIARQVLKEINSRLEFMSNVGLDYLALDRKSNTLSGGESQRIRLATQIGAGLVGVLYVLDEPSIGLHQKDNEKLLRTLKELQDLGNTLIVVEHDETTIRTADHIIDLGPGAGEHGGRIIAQGTIKDILASKTSITGKYLRKEVKISIPEKRREPSNFIQLKGVTEHNLKNIDVNIPLGCFVCVTGVSGSGKSTLIDDVLYAALTKKIYGSKITPGKHKSIIGINNIDKVIEIDQSPIGRTPRSNPCTYTGAFGPIRDLFAKLPESKIRGYKAGRFSFNVKGGRCENCTGDGIKKIEMHFLPDVYVQCETCKGKRFNEQTLAVHFKGKSISEVLEMTVDEACELFINIPSVRQKLKTLQEVGLGYIRLGQSATTLSGGEAQRIKLATELSKRATGKTLYILDEPTTGLHFADVHKLVDVLQKLVSTGNTVLVIEHNLEVVKQSDHIIDLGPEGGDQGGEVLFTGTPEEIVKCKRSYTGKFLKELI
ncbi:MAG: excinuclease ABC subunit UvrA [Candidatus Omnitrophica bacterium]|nr:excinuclease ABC subunit UvrA [Candidatus Omnitrophota bacterium]